ncbi:hypothetical protein O6B97_08815 [Campylobacter ureolyticus]|uniref:hypothetical protein n=1 Tax=Campylobacter ureolyticus TaxID=827 RepID=UPI001FC83EBC|nr:hypothetical protein [Campylobacter ureolyticus]MCZ6106191.1 hypothetical protein [Campylobacter ureolyticus]MCZ6158819.1 hypothetical protein [Campylobacter ureolyticus]MCZ6174312.1 hypothetical protein [Campylobacter ureolyticus]MCZ6187185.1 hypothetical protein [Campylobacter ureolyticus]MDU5326522.1 hypothetical protein [Campylobacter ureolyticus]
MKKRHKILISITVLTTAIVLGLNYSGFCFREFKYLSDDEILKNYLDSAAIKKIMYDDYGGIPPEFYFIKENPTNYEIIRTLKHIVNNDIDKTVKTRPFSYMGEPREEVTTESLNIFEALKKYYTIEDITYKVDAGDKWENGKYIYRYADVPINQAFIMLSQNFFIYIYGKDAFSINEKRKLHMRYFTYINSTNNYTEYDIIDGKRADKGYTHDSLSRFIERINEYYKNYKDITKKSEQSFIEINNCGIAEDRL